MIEITLSYAFIHSTYMSIRSVFPALLQRIGDVVYIFRHFAGEMNK